ncbi:MAG: acetyl-CoA acetyltransferase [Actinobacteria bacterium]|nr:acetyl-CoA acetyltransferase [Actinomycetota bacterium]
MGNDLTVRGRVAVVGVGESTYYKRGQSPDPEFVLLLKAILAACADAGIAPSQIDGFCSYSNDRNDPPRLAAALGLRELRFSNMQWTSGGGGAAGAVGNAAAAIVAGNAECVVAFRSLAQGQFGRFGQGGGSRPISGEYAYQIPYGKISPAQSYAMRTTRVLWEHGISRDTMKAIALAAYHHAQNNPRAVMYGRPLTPEAYDESRWIVEPYRLFDCCQENDGAAAVVLMSAERARELRVDPVYVLGAQQGGPRRSGAWADNNTDYATSSFKHVAERLFAQAQLGPADVDVVQSYENFTGGVLMSLIEHGFCTYENANEVLTFDNLVAPKGRLPLNTSGGNLAECYMHGLGLVIEAVRQIRGESSNQVPGAKVALASAGPMVPVVSSLIVGNGEALG